MRSMGLALVLILTGCAVPTITVSEELPESSTPALAPSPSSPPSSAASPSSTEAPSRGPITRDEAMELARRAVDGEGWQIVRVQAGSLGEVMPGGWEHLERGQGLSADLPVWSVVMAAGQASAGVLIDSRDGSVVSAVIGIAN